MDMHSSSDVWHWGWGLRISSRKKSTLAMYVSVVAMFQEVSSGFTQMSRCYDGTFCLFLYSLTRGSEETAMAKAMQKTSSIWLTHCVQCSEPTLEFS